MHFYSQKQQTWWREEKVWFKEKLKGVCTGPGDRGIVPVPPWVRENESHFWIWRGKWIKEGVNFLGRKSEDFNQMLQRLCHGYVSVCQHCYFLSSACTHTPDSQCTLKSLSLPGAELKGKRVILHPQSSYHCKILSLSSQPCHLVSLCLAFPVINQINIITVVL